MNTETLNRDTLVAGQTFGAHPYVCAASQTLVRGQVVALNSSGKIAAAGPDDDIFGIVADNVTTGASDTDKSVDVYTVGVFDKDSIVFASDFEAADKVAALKAMRYSGMITVKVV